MKCEILLHIFLVSLAYCTEGNKNILRIIGGRNASENEFPYVVRIMTQNINDSKFNNFVCSSIVLTSTWTLTAAHCIYFLLADAEIEATGKVVILYFPESKQDPAYSEVLSMTPHPSFTEGKNDIGLLRTQPVVFEKYGKLSSIEYTTLIGQQVFLVGYGMISNNEDTWLHVPQVLEVVVKECTEINHYPELCFAPPCSAQKYEMKAVCPGDSGGPAIHASGVVGVNILTDERDCGIYRAERSRRDRYDVGYNSGVAAPVSLYLDWITSTMNSAV